MPRCRVNDLAIIVGCSKPENARYVGRIVRCVHQFTHDIGPAWLIDPAVPGCLGIADKHLRPIRDTDEPDETLFLAGKPNTADRIEALRSAMRKERA